MLKDSDLRWAVANASLYRRFSRCQENDKEQPLLIFYNYKGRIRAVLNNTKKKDE